jgi:Raf kinase inhibitor-like YbhB/YbcL family protein
MQLSSPAFDHQAEIPMRHTCEGADIAPALNWRGVPSRAKSLALIVDDPDAPDPAAPRRTWVHWVLYDIPARDGGLAEGGQPLPEGTREGLNDWQHPGWGGPCPPIGRHRYFFKLYALDTVLPALPPHAGKAAVEEGMRGHVLAYAELIGTYRKHRP